MTTRVRLPPATVQVLLANSTGCQDPAVHQGRTSMKVRTLRMRNGKLMGARVVVLDLPARLPRHRVSRPRLAAPA
jgi:hypothetical protein